MDTNYKPGFTYQEFARDFTGQHFNATEWVQMFAQSGAKYIVLTSKHRELIEIKNEFGIHLTYYNNTSR